MRTLPTLYPNFGNFISELSESYIRTLETVYRNFENIISELYDMEQGTVIFVPRGVSQAAACDDSFCQIPTGNDNTNPLPGLLPI